MATKDISDLQVVQAYHAYWTDKQTGNYTRPLDRLMAATGQPQKVCWRAMERADHRGLVDWGVSLGVGWLTDKGKALLEHGHAENNAVQSGRA